MKKIFQQYREILAFFLYVLIIAALVWGVIFPLIAKINELRDQIQEQDLKQQSDREHLSELPKIEQQYEYVKKNKNLIDVLFDDNGAVSLIERLEKIADNSGNKITIAVQDATQQKNAASNAKTKTDNALINALPSSNYLQLKITLDGDYNSIVKFVDELEKMEYYSDVIDLQIQNKQNNSSSTDSSSNNIFDAKNSTANPQQVTQNGAIEGVLDVVFYTNN